jgi:carbon storage regulator CsrA
MSLVISRKAGEGYTIHTSDGPVHVTLTSIDGNRTRHAIDAPPQCSISRDELAVTSIDECESTEEHFRISSSDPTFKQKLVDFLATVEIVPGSTKVVLNTSKKKESAS